MLFSNQTQRNEDLTFLHFIPYQKQRKVYSLDTLTIRQLPQIPTGVVQKSDPNINSVYCHHYSVDTQGPCSLMSFVEFGPTLLLGTAEGLVAHCFPADAHEQLSKGCPIRAVYRTNPATWRASPFCSHC